MNKDEFLQTLKASLEDFTEEERNDILYDYEEHFRIGFENGESEDKLIEDLGDPMSIANQYKISGNYEKNTEANEQNTNIPYSDPLINTENKNYNKPVVASVLAALSLLLFNLIFILGPYIGLVGVLIGIFAAAIGVTIGGLGLSLGTILMPLFRDFITLPPIPSGANFLFGIGTIALGILFTIGACYLAKYFFKGTAKYIKWNLSIIKR